MTLRAIEYDDNYALILSLIETFAKISLNAKASEIDNDCETRHAVVHDVMKFDYIVICSSISKDAFLKLDDSVNDETKKRSKFPENERRTTRLRLFKIELK